MNVSKKQRKRQRKRQNPSDVNVSRKYDRKHIYGIVIGRTQFVVYPTCQYSVYNLKLPSSTDRLFEV